MAGEMRLAAHGPDIEALFAEMSRAQGVAAGLLHGARAMTDVTGFGLAGHLLNMADPSGVGADVQLDAVPVYDGALALAEKGIRSTLYPANRAALEGRVTGAEGPRADLLFDPQTAGGMLAALARGGRGRGTGAAGGGGIPRGADRDGYGWAAGAGASLSACNTPDASASRPASSSVSVRRVAMGPLPDRARDLA